jgi:hypothetical protein
LANHSSKESYRLRKSDYETEEEARAQQRSIELLVNELYLKTNRHVLYLKTNPKKIFKEVQEYGLYLCVYQQKWGKYMKVPKNM